MKATTGAAVLATIGLLALSACFHDDSERPATDETDEATETFDDLRGTNAAEILDVTGAAALSPPRSGGGGVVQSAGVGLASASGVSTSFDGTDLTVTISREDGSALTLNSGSDASETSGTTDSPIAGHSAQNWVLFEPATDGMSIAIATVTANQDDAADYLTVGHWMHIAVDVAEFSFTGAETGAFVDGPELMAPPASLPAQGTASYYGPASGAYSVLHGTDTGVVPGSTESGMFNSTIELAADFAANTISGCVGCRDGVALFGTLDDAGTGESTEVMFEDSGYRLYLDSTALDPNGTFLGEDMRLEHPHISIASTEGAWGGRFSSIADSTGDPRLVAGTFGAEATSVGGSEGAFLGSFVGTKE